MRLLIIDPMGNALDLAMRAQAAGHEVKLFVRQTEKTRHIGRGLADVVEEFRPWLRWAGLVFNADNSLYLRDLDAFRQEMPSTPVVGATAETAAWELDRTLGQQVLRRHGVATIPCKEFSDYDAAITHVKRTDARCVSKPSGDADKALSYCAQSPEDMVYMLQRWKRVGKLKAPFILQEFVEGTEMAVGGWHGPGGFNEGWCENLEHKKLMNGDLGVATGEQGTILRYVRQSKLADRVLAPLARTLEKLNYVGYIDVNCIVDDAGRAWPLEFTMRPGWPTYNIQEPLHRGDPAQWLADLTRGTDARVATLDRVAAGVVMSVPDYPYSHLTRKEVVGIPIYGLRPSVMRHVHPCEMMLGKDLPVRAAGEIVASPMMVTAGDYVLVMTATSETAREAAATCYRRLERLVVPNSPMWRTDIGRRLAHQLPKLQARGYATGMAYSPTS